MDRGSLRKGMEKEVHYPSGAREMRQLLDVEQSMHPNETPNRQQHRVKLKSGSYQRKNHLRLHQTMCRSAVKDTDQLGKAIASSQIQNRTTLYKKWSTIKPRMKPARSHH